MCGLSKRRAMRSCRSKRGQWGVDKRYRKTDGAMWVRQSAKVTYNERISSVRKLSCASALQREVRVPLATQGLACLPVKDGRKGRRAAYSTLLCCNS